MAVVRLNSGPVRLNSGPTLKEKNRIALENIRIADQQAMRQRGVEYRNDDEGGWRGDTPGERKIMEHIGIHIRHILRTNRELREEVSDLNDLFQKAHRRLIHLESVERQLRAEIATLKAGRR